MMKMRLRVNKITFIIRHVFCPPIYVCTHGLHMFSKPLDCIIAELTF